MPFHHDFLLLLILTSLFNQNYAGLFRQIEKSQSESLPQYYTRMRSSNVNRGVLLTMSLKEQKEACRNAFTSQTFQNEGIYFVDDVVDQTSISSELSENESLASIVVRKMSFEEQIIAEEEIFVTCPGTEENVVILGETPQIDLYYISFAFETNIFLVSQKEGLDDATVEMVADYKLTMSPEIALGEDSPKITDLFVVTRRNIEALREESPKYVEMIEERDDIQALSDDDKLLVCGSILSSPRFQSQNLEIDLEWVEKREKIATYNRPIGFLNENYKPNVELYSQNISCKARDSRTQKKYAFFYTGSYNDKNSVFFLKIEYSDLQFDSYIENIPILMHIQRKLRPIHTAVTL